MICTPTPSSVNNPAYNASSRRSDYERTTHSVRFRRLLRPAYLKSRRGIQIFGVERTIYGSNFPLEKLHASYADFLGVYRTVLAEYTEADQRKVLHDNAVKFYRL